MISFKQFLKEDEGFDLEEFKKDCAPFLSELKGTRGKNLLFHGTAEPVRGDFEIRTWRERKHPRDSSDEMHNAVNKFFEERFGYPLRNWLFTTGRSGDAMIYAGTAKSLNVIFPIGDFDYACGLDKDLQDLTGWHSRVASDIRNADTKDSITYDEREILASRHMISKMRHMNWKFNEGLVECIKSNNEIYVKCKEFYAIRWYSDTFDDIIAPFLKTL